MVRVPISIENIDFVRLDLSRHYTVIDCDFTCYIVLNPTGVVPFSGTDIAVINIGSWQINTWGFLSKNFFPVNPGFSACLVWDKTLVQDTEQGRKAPRLSESDVDVSDSVSSLRGQPVNIVGFSLDDGKSLKVSTLENEFCNVRPYPFSNYEDSVFRVSHSYRTLSVNDVLDLSFLPSFCVSEIEGGFSVKDVGLSFITVGDYSIICKPDKSFWSSWLPSGYQNSYDYKGFGDLVVNFTVTDDVISNISVNGVIRAGEIHRDGSFFNNNYTAVTNRITLFI